MDGIAEIRARIAEIESQFGMRAAGGVLGTGPNAAKDPTASTPTSDFGSALASAQTAATADTTVPTSSGDLNPGGVDSTKWARDFLTKLGMPITSENVRAIKAWEAAEGTKAHFNPLATTQSGFAGETRFNSVGVKNYVQYQDGIDANAHALTNGLYKNVLAALKKGDDALAVADAIQHSPWGT